MKTDSYFDDLSTIWDNKDGCEEKYICDTALHLLSMLSHAYYILIDRSIGSPGNGREVVDGLNATNKRMIAMLMTKLQIPCDEDYDTHMEMNTPTPK